MMGKAYFSSFFSFSISFHPKLSCFSLNFPTKDSKQFSPVFLVLEGFLSTTFVAQWIERSSLDISSYKFSTYFFILSNQVLTCKSSSFTPFVPVSKLFSSCPKVFQEELENHSGETDELFQDKLREIEPEIRSEVTGRETEGN